MRIGPYLFDIEPDDMSDVQLGVLKEYLDEVWEQRTFNRVERNFDDAFMYAKEQGYKVFYEGKELNPTDIYIATEAP